jgi:aminoglycoside 3-N-acetyltransferase
VIIVKDIRLFQCRETGFVSDKDILECLYDVNASEAKYLYIHSSLSFGIPNPDLDKNEVLEALWNLIRELKVPTICVPTFTFSFCNGRDYDVAKSRSRMGVLNEYIRRLPQAVRSRDPLMSVAAVGQDTSIVEDIGRHSIGVDSTFDKLRAKGGTKFLFLGARPCKCMTYVHYVEERLGVPYRYNREFTGNITDASGTSTETFTLFVRYQGVQPREADDYEQFLIDNGLMLKRACGDSFIYAVDETSVYGTLVEALDEDIDFLLAEPYSREWHDTRFEARNMVAL